MPAAYAHQRCAEMALALLSPIDREILEANPSAYLLGAQGPDILFFYGTLPPFRNHSPNRIGVQLHRMPGQRFARELLMRGRGSDAAAATWALGYLCHWAADALLHPYILSRQYERPFAHGLLEQGADTHLYQLEREGVPRQMAFLDALKPQEARAIGILFSVAVGAALPNCLLTARQVEIAIQDARRTHAVLYSPDGKRFRRFRRLERLLRRPGLITSHMPPPVPRYDPLNLQRREFPLPNGMDAMSNQTYPELLQCAAQQTARGIQAALAYWDNRLSLDDALSVMGNARMEDGS